MHVSELLQKWCPETERCMVNYCFWQGKGEFTMEYFQHAAVPQDVQSQLVKEYSSKRATV